MFDIGATELLLIVIVAVIVIGPKDLPLAMRTAGRWIGKVRRISGHFRSGIDAMVREAELEEMEEKWRKQNEAVMKAHPDVSADAPEDAGVPAPASAEAALASPPADESEPVAQESAKDRAKQPGTGKAKAGDAEDDKAQAEPQLPLTPP